MSFARAVTKYVRISPRKARLAADLIRGLSVEEAGAQLVYSKLRGGRLLKKTLDSAIANAETTLDAKRENMWVDEVRIDVGPTIKRSKSKSRGGVTPIMKRTSHFTIVLRCEKEGSEK